MASRAGFLASSGCPSRVRAEFPRTISAATPGAPHTNGVALSATDARLCDVHHNEYSVSPGHNFIERCSCRKSKAIGRTAHPQRDTPMRQMAIDVACVKPDPCGWKSSVSRDLAVLADLPIEQGVNIDSERALDLQEVTVSTDQISRPIKAAGRSPQRSQGRLREGSGLCLLPTPTARRGGMT